MTSSGHKPTYQQTLTKKDGQDYTVLNLNSKKWETAAKDFKVGCVICQQVCFFVKGFYKKYNKYFISQSF